MESAAAMNTVFGIVVPIPKFELSYPLAVAFIVLCIGAWILTVIDIRRKSSDNIPTQEEIDREFDRLVRRR